MKPTRILPLVLLSALWATGCDDQTGPNAEGTVSFQVTLAAPPTEFEQTPMPDFPTTAKGAPGTGSGPLHFASAGPGRDTSVVTPRWDSTGTLFQAQTIDAVQVQLGNQTVTMTQQGNEFVGTSAQMAAGSYDAVIIGTEGGLATYYKEQSITITGGDVDVSITLDPFVPTLQPFQTPTTFTAVATVFTSIASATGYVIEVDIDPSFAAASQIPTTGSPTGLSATDAGLFYLRVRAENANITAAEAMPSNVEQIEILPDTLGGSDAGTAYPVGTGVYDSLNILPAGDEDWYRIDLTAGQSLTAGVYAETLTPASDLDPTLTLFNSVLDTIAFNDDDTLSGTLESYLDAIPILNTDTYYLVVAGYAGVSTGYYELEVDVGNGIDSVAVTPAADTVNVAGDTTRLTATAYDGTGTPFNGVAFTWSSSDNNLATVDSTGLVTTIDQGTVTITALASDGVTSGTAQVTALLPPVDEVRLDRDVEFFTGTGGSAGFTATAYSGGNPVGGITFTWFSLDSNVATIDNAGNVTAAGAGQAAIGASAGSFTAYATITVDDPEGTPINLFASEATGTSSSLEGAFGFTSSDFYVFGAGIIQHFDGNAWSTAATPAASVNAMWGANPNNVFAVGGAGYIGRYNGNVWRADTSGTTEHLWGVWGASPADVFAVGDNGTILYFDGRSWTTQATPVTAHLWAVWGTSATDVFAVGESGTIVHYDGASWSTMTSGTTNHLEGVWGHAPDSVYAVGSNNTIVVYDGANWNPVGGLPSGATFKSVWGTGSSDIYVAGLGDNMYFDGAAWTRISGDSFKGIYGSHGANAIVVAVGDTGIVDQGYRGALFQANAALDTLVSIDDTVRVVVSVSDSSGNPISGTVPVTWESSDSAVAVPDANGLVTAVGAGFANIGAISSSLNDVFTITVYQTVDSVSMSLDTLIVDIGVTDTLIASAFDANGYAILNRATAWSSTDGGIASVDPDSGFVDGVQTGGVVVSADVDGVVGTTTVLVPLAVVTATTTSVGYYHSCGLDTGGNAWCWGANSEGQLGDGTTTPSSSPVAVTGGLTFTSLSAGSYHTCGVTAGYEVYCWGQNGSGQLGTGDYNPQTSPTLVTGGHLFVNVEAGESFTCGLTLIGEGWCWGANYTGQLGNGGSGYSPSPVTVFGGMTFGSITAGSQHACATELSGAAWCWGSNYYGQFGDGNTGTTSTVPVAVSQGMLTLGWIRAGYEYTCALDSGGAQYCWGYNWAGQLGVGDYNDRITPTAVLGGLTFRAIDPGVYHNCATTTTDAGYCWGYNYYGQVGDSTQSYQTSPSPVYGGLSFADVAAGYQHSCGRAVSGMMYCWGDASSGQVGGGNPLGDVPRPVAGGINFSYIQAGANHTCGLDTGNAPWCWGAGNAGQLGNAMFLSDSLPVAVTGPTLSMLRSGYNHTCGIGVADSLSYCWGGGGNGQLGNASTSSSAVPVTSTGGIKFSTIDAGAYHTCAIEIPNTAVCWGYNFYGQLGQGTSGSGTDLTIPSVVSGGVAMTHISAAYSHTCGIAAADSTAYCWGRNSNGELGDGTQTDASTPQSVQGGIQFRSIATGYRHTCGIAIADSTAYCWGSGSYTGGAGTVSSPTPITGGMQFKQLEINMGFHTCGVTYADEIYCWGSNSYGQLGIGGTNFQTLPTLQMAGLSGAVLGLGYYHSCAVTSTNTGYCWGDNESAQLGLGFGTRRLAPVVVTGGITFATPPPSTGGGGNDE